MMNKNRLFDALSNGQNTNNNDDIPTTFSKWDTRTNQPNHRQIQHVCECDGKKNLIIFYDRLNSLPADARSSIKIIT